jgi:hypothetical protein
VYSSLTEIVGSIWKRAVGTAREAGAGSTRWGAEGTFGDGISCTSGMTGTGAVSGSGGITGTGVAIGGGAGWAGTAGG